MSTSLRFFSPFQDPISLRLRIFFSFSIHPPAILDFNNFQSSQELRCDCKIFSNFFLLFHYIKLSWQQFIYGTSYTSDHDLDGEVNDDYEFDLLYLAFQWSAILYHLNFPLLLLRFLLIDFKYIMKILLIQRMNHWLLGSNNAISLPYNFLWFWLLILLAICVLSGGVHEGLESSCIFVLNLDSMLFTTL